MRHPMRVAAAALLLAVPIAGCAASTTNGAGTVVRSGSRTGSPSTSAAPTAPGPTGSSPSVSFAPVTGRQTALAFDGVFLSALTALRITPGTAGRATFDAGTGSLDLPITTGTLVVTGTKVLGLVRSSGSGLSLRAASTTITFTDLVVDYSLTTVRSDVLINGATVDRNVSIIDLGTAAQRTVATSSTVTVSGDTARISGRGAALLNAAFGTTAISPGTPVGNVTVIATG